MERLIYLIVPVIIGFVMIDYKKELMILFKKKILGDISKHEMYIAVLSARGNTAQREAIRNSWWSGFTQVPEIRDQVELRFVVGKHACDIPPDYREDIYDCQPWNISYTEKDGGFLAVVEERKQQLSNSTDSLLPYFPIQTISFKVQYPVIVGKLGLHSQSIGQKTLVRLLDAATNTEIVSTVFTKESPGVLVEGFRYKAVEAYLLPKGFEGVVVSEHMDEPPTLKAKPQELISMETDSGGGIIQFIDLDLDLVVDGHYSDPRFTDSLSIILPSFIYDVHDAKSLQKFIKNYTKQHEEWQKQLMQEQVRLEEESEKHGDIHIVPDLVDVYRHLPHKLLAFYKWLSEEEQFDFVLKTDDDCFVHLAQITEALKEHKVKDKLWWSRFRNHWVVEHHGKWREHVYKSLTYPRFACGSGSILSRDLVDWMADNSDSLQMYQGEDTSVGIWLSAVGPSYQDDSHFQCEKECLSSLYTLPDLTPEEMQQTWMDVARCGDPCGCT